MDGWWLIVGVAAVTVLVLVPYVAVLVVWGFHWTPNGARDRLGKHEVDAADPRGSEYRRPLEIVHPYLGYVLNPCAEDCDWTEAGWPRPVVNRFGFESPADPLAPDQGQLRIAVVGGSVAKAFANGAGGERLKRALRDDSQQRIEICCLCVGGYKAPQALMAVAYMLALGARFDAVVNIDGFNEVVLHPSEAAGREVCPTFPRSWYGRAALYLSWRRMALMGRATLHRARRRRVARLAGGPLLRYVPLAFLLAELLDEALREKVQLLERALSEERDLENTTNRHVLAEDPATLVALWARSSLTLHSLCRGHGIPYFHFLQPSQYDAGAKPLSAEELRDAFLEGHPYQPYARHAYPLLRAKGLGLIAAGVAFCDLSGVFAREERTVYADRCCHLNEYGNQVLASVMGRYIRSSLRDTLRAV